MMDKKPWILSGALLVACWLGVSPALASDVADVRERGELVVLTWPHQESVFSHRMVKELGEEGLRVIGGIDIDVMRRFAERLGVELRVEPVKPDFAALIPSLVAGEGDVIASSLTITAKRNQVVDFSAPYFRVQKVVVVKKGSPITKMDDLMGKVASVAHGTSHEEQLQALFDNLKIRPVQFMLENYEAVAEGNADYTVVDSSSARRVLGEYLDLGEQLKVGFAFPESDYFAFAVREGSDLKAELDDFITELRHSGELEQILAKHMEPEAVAAGSLEDESDEVD